MVEEFTHRLASFIEAEVIDRARRAATAALGGAARSRPRGTSRVLVLNARKVRRTGPKQLCPVPGCKNPAAPVFGMVCAAHKDVPKTKIKKYREARRAAKAKRAA